MHKQKLFPLAGLVIGLTLLWVLLYPGRLQGDPPPGADQQPGFEDFKTYCARCHGLDGRSIRSSRIADRPVSLVDSAWREKTTVSKLRRVIVNGEGKMDGFGGDLSEEQVSRLVDYVFWMPVDSTSAQPLENQPE